MKSLLFLLLSGIACWSCAGNGRAAPESAATEPVSPTVQNQETPAAPPTDTGAISLPAGYVAFDSATFNLDGDAWPDKLRALEPQRGQKGDGYYHPVVVYQLLRGTGKNSFALWAENKLLLNGLGDNCPADGYQRMIAKPPYFTVEQVVCAGFKFASQFVTFKYNKATKQVLLHKWGEQYTDRSDPEKPLADFIHTPADFGSILFEEASPEKVRD